MTRPSNELLTDRHRAEARWLPTTVVVPLMEEYKNCGLNVTTNYFCTSLGRARDQVTQKKHYKCSRYQILLPWISVGYSAVKICTTVYLKIIFHTTNRICHASLS